MLRKISVALLVAILIFFSFGCKKKAEVKGVSLDVEFSEDPLTDYLITDMTYHWKMAEDFEKLGRDFSVFVHFWHGNNLLFQDDHFPEVPTSKWEPGKEYTYSRRILIPQFIDEFDPEFKGEEELRLVIGIISPYDKSSNAKRDILEEKLKVLPPPLDTPEIIYEDGWYDLEVNPEAYLKQWRWTSKVARCVVDNPKRDALLVIKGGVNLEALENQKVIFKINDMVLDEFIPEESHFEKTYNVKKEMLGEGDEFYLTITTDKTFIPAEAFPDSADERELGLQISFLYFR
ncbi:MAG: hypothetical protein JXB26_10240 [Candidatus Aminicenantes bacterium]|nr:hypothetical protein [Candidatus Aminicenantes bacterium]